MVSASLNQRAVVGPVCLWIYPGRKRRSEVWLGAFSQEECTFSSPGWLKARGEESSSEGRTRRRSCPCSLKKSQLSVSALCGLLVLCNDSNQKRTVTVNLLWMCCGSLGAQLGCCVFTEVITSGPEGITPRLGEVASALWGCLLFPVFAYNLYFLSLDSFPSQEGEGVFVLVTSYWSFIS